MKFRNKNRKINILDRENTRIASEYFIKVFNYNKEVNLDYIRKTLIKRRLFYIANPIILKELNEAIS